MSLLRLNVKTWYLLIFLALFSSCGSLPLTNSKHSPPPEVKALINRIKSNPNDVEAITSLGIYYYQARNYPLALKIFQKAREVDSLYPVALCYLGLTHEAQKEWEKAAQIYQMYHQFEEQSLYSTWLRGREILLQKKERERELLTLLQEPTEKLKKVSPTTLAIFPFTYLGNAPIFAPIRKGLAELLIRDLQRIPRLTVIDRWKIQLLFDEIRNRTSLLTNENTTIRIGKLTGAGSVIRCSYNVLENDILVVDIAFWDILHQQFPTTSTHAEKIENLLYLEKELMLSILERLNMTIPTDLSDELMELPTQSWEAFLAYSAALEQEDAGDYQRAASLLEKALGLDADFQLCKERLNVIRLLAIATTPPEKLIYQSAQEQPNAQVLRD